MTRQLDVQVEDHGSIVVLRPLTPEGSDWIAEHVASEPWQWLGGGLGCDHRMAPAVIEGMLDAGLEVRS